MNVRPVPVVPLFRWLTAACLLGEALLGCGSPPPPASPAARAVHQLAGSDGRIEWRGVLACADCDGIDTQLVLQRIGGLSDYRLTETYLAVDQGARFAEHGHWQRESDLLRLQGDNGSRRVFALLPDGRLQPRDGHGKPLSSRADEFLVPVAVASGQ